MASGHRETCVLSCGCSWAVSAWRVTATYPHVLSHIGTQEICESPKDRLLALDLWGFFVLFFLISFVHECPLVSPTLLFTEGHKVLHAAHAPKPRQVAVNRHQQHLKAQRINGIPGLAQMWLCLGHARYIQGTYAVDVEQVGYPHWESPQAQVHINIHAAKIVYFPG